MPTKTLTIIGLGNDLIADDGVGIYAARSLKTRIDARQKDFSESISIQELPTGGFQLLDQMIGYDTCIVIDAVMSGLHPPGTIYRQVLAKDDRPVKLLFSHQVNLLELLGLAELLKIEIPSTTVVYGIEAKDVTTFSTTCTQEVRKALPELVDLVLEDILGHRWDHRGKNVHTAEFLQRGYNSSRENSIIRPMNHKGWS